MRQRQKAREMRRNHGIGAFYLPLLQAAVTSDDGLFVVNGVPASGTILLMKHWIFMVWRLSVHSSVPKMRDELLAAFPDIYPELLRTVTISVRC